MARQEYKLAAPLGLAALLDELARRDELRVIDTPLDIYLEIPHLAYLEAKLGERSQALLFTHPVDSRGGKKFAMPVLMNLFTSRARCELILGCTSDKISSAIARLLGLHSPTPPPYSDKVASIQGDKFKGLAKRSIIEKIQGLVPLARLAKSLPKKVARSSSYIYLGDDIDLYSLPILTTWEGDGGPFITMGHVYTTSLNGRQQNIGMYRLQIYSKNTLGLHWQIHKDANHFFHEYKRAGVKMPVSIGIGGDPLYIWCGQAPLPCGVYELGLYGYMRDARARVSKCVTNQLYLPDDIDIIIEGFCDPREMADEGPFGDHTGYYTPLEPYPLLEVSALRIKKGAIYHATVVGKPPLEDKYMGEMTGEVFMPMLQKIMPELLEYYMPENGVFHNLILAKIAPFYPGHGKKSMHSFFATGQMSFVKHVILLPPEAPELRDFDRLTRYILERFSPSCLVFSDGITDALDHASNEYAAGSKLCLDLTGDEDFCALGSARVALKSEKIKIDDAGLLAKLQEGIDKISNLTGKIKDAHIIYANTPNPILLLALDKDTTRFNAMIAPLAPVIKKYASIVVLLDDSDNDTHNLYMSLWRVVNNIDARRDIEIVDDIVLLDASKKGTLEGYPRIWPDETNCTQSVISRLDSLGLNPLDKEQMEHFYIVKSGRASDRK